MTKETWIGVLIFNFIIPGLVILALGLIANEWRKRRKSKAADG